MNKEIERKWLMKSLPVGIDQFASAAIVQGYVINQQGTVLRVRTVVGPARDSRQGFITVKAPTEELGVNHEYEMEIPFQTATTLLEGHKGPKLSKLRYTIPHGDLKIELDLYNASLAGLAIIEVEFPEVGMPFDPPEWFGVEMTGDPGVSNAHLVKLC